MKKFPLIIFISSILLTALTSCTLEEDINPIDTDIRDKFVGTWSLSESIVSRSISYDIEIDYDLTNSAQVTIENMGNLGNSKIITGLATSSRIVIYYEIDGITIEGTGTSISNNQMSWAYSVKGGGDIEYFEATAIKK